MENFASRSKRKNDDKPKGRPRHTLRLALASSLAFVLIAAGVFARTRFTPMSDVPRDDLVYAEGLDTYTLDFQTGKRTSGPPENRIIDIRETSPDGRWEIRLEWIDKYNMSSLVLEDLTGQEPKRTFGKFYVAGNTLSWSPDQQWVAFTAYDPELHTSSGVHAAEIWKVHIPTGSVTRLSHNTYLDSDPSFSPDGTQIVYMSAADGNPRIYVMDVASVKSRLLTPNQYGVNPRWSPDGQWIAFESWYQDNYQYPRQSDNKIKIFIIRADGAHVQPIAFGKIGVGHLIGWKSQ